MTVIDLTDAGAATGRILLVESDLDARRLAAQGLRALGHVVAEAGTAEQARDWMRAWSVDLVVVARDVPEQRGLSELTVPPVLLITGAADPRRIADALRAPLSA